MLQVAMARDALRRVSSAIRMYLRKQSLDQRPILWIRYFGHPIAAAVDAAPMRSECDDMFMAPSDMSRNVPLMSGRVRKEPLLNIKRGPVGLG